MPELTAPAEITSCSFLIDTPDFAAAAHASAVAVAIACAMKLLMSFSMWPCPGGPAWMTFSQNGREHRLQLREHRVVGADHRVEPALLGFDRRARERRIDELARASRRNPSRIFAVDAGSAVDVSTTISPSRARRAMPFIAVDDLPRSAACR